jgi:hypothetical protein
MVSFAPRPLYPRRKNTRYPLYRRLDRPQSRSGRRREEKILDPIGTRTPTLSVVQPVASRYTNCPIPAPFYNGIFVNYQNIHYIQDEYIYFFPWRVMVGVISLMGLLLSKCYKLLSMSSVRLRVFVLFLCFVRAYVIMDFALSSKHRELKWIELNWTELNRVGSPQYSENDIITRRNTSSAFSYAFVPSSCRNHRQISGCTLRDEKGLDVSQ